jgi:hypothetical protein
LVRS